MSTLREKVVAAFPGMVVGGIITAAIIGSTNFGIYNLNMDACRGGDDATTLLMDDLHASESSSPGVLLDSLLVGIGQTASYHICQEYHTVSSRK